ncbi:MAG: YhjD/YihY/BrkB family envelope integrity protein [bacterium]
MTAPDPSKTRRFLTTELWNAELSTLTGVRSLVVRTVRILQLVGKGFREDDLFLHASALTFSLLMSLVPLLAIAFAVLKGLGAGEEASSRLMTSIDTMPTQFQAFMQQILDIVNRTNVAALGWVGVVVLFFTVVQVLGSVERSFNRVWGIPTSRPILRRFTNYISVTVVVPVLIMAAFAISATLSSPRISDLLGLAAPLYRALLRLTPLVAVWIAFFFLFVFMPNTSVRRRTAAGGALITAIAWLVWQRLYIFLQAQLATGNAIYGTFASIPVFLMWLYVCWVIILLGAELAFALQNHETYHMERIAGHANVRAKIALAMSAVFQAARSFTQGHAPFHADAYAHERLVPIRLLNDVVALLTGGGYLAEIGEETRKYVLARSPELITVREVVNLVLREGAARENLGLTRLDPVVEKLFRGFESSIDDALGTRTFKDLLDAEQAGVAR